MWHEKPQLSCLFGFDKSYSTEFEKRILLNSSQVVQGQQSDKE